MNTLKIGTIGSGMIVREILNALKFCPNAECTAVYSRSNITAAELAQTYSAERWYTDLDEMYSDPEVNCIYIASPNSLHFSQARQALEHGKHVILEKPFCSTAKQAEALLEIARQQGRMIIEAVTTCFLPNYQILKSLIPELGKIRIVKCSYIQYSSRYNKLLAGEVPNVFNPAFGGGCLADLNYYNLHFAVSLFGVPRSAGYIASRYPGLADTSGILTLNYPEMTCVCTGAKDCRGESSVMICGERGYLSIPDSCNSMCKICADISGEKRTYRAQEHENRWIYEMQELVPLLLSENRDAIARHNRITLEAVAVMEQARKGAGILFLEDKE